MTQYAMGSIHFHEYTADSEMFEMITLEYIEIIFGPQDKLRADSLP